jgi:hypothetical protein
MSSPKTHERNLYAALGCALEAPEIPAHMSVEKEAAALFALCAYVVTQSRTGDIPVVKLMVLAQQALRCAALAYTQQDERDAVVSHLLSKTVPS